MPELPEVQTIVNDLNKIIIREKIKDVTIFYEKMIHTDWDLFHEAIIGSTITHIDRFGKYLLFELSSGYVLRVHLRMEGKFYVSNVFDDPALDKHTHVIFHFESGNMLKYHDVRKFGTMEIIPRPQSWHDDEKFATLGYEPWEKECTPEFIYMRMQKSSRMIKPFLLDQKTIVGLGNIYVDEVLFASKIHPATRSNVLKKSDAKKISEHAQYVMDKAISLGGTTIRTYHNTLGIDGLFQNELQVHLQVDEPCPRCGTIIVKKQIGGRGSYYCPRCQKIKI